MEGPDEKEEEKEVSSPIPSTAPAGEIGSPCHVLYSTGLHMNVHAADVCTHTHTGTISSTPTHTHTHSRPRRHGHIPRVTRILVLYISTPASLIQKYPSQLNELDPARPLTTQRIRD